MKNKLFSIFTALAMVLGILVSPFTSAHAADGDAATTVDKTTNIYLHKLLMTSSELEKWSSKAIKEKGYNATQNVDQFKQLLDEGHSADDIKDVFFAVKNSDGQYIGEDGKALAENLQDPTAEGFEDAVLGGRTVKGTGLNLDVSKLEQKNTEYTIEEIPELTTYKGPQQELLAASKAVSVKITLPITNNNGVVPEAHVYPKNTQEKPQIDKNFAKNHGLTSIEDNKNNNNVGADYNRYQEEKATVTAELGKEVPYEVKTKVNAGSRYQTLNWKDTMSNGLTFNKDKGVTIEAKTIVPEGQTPETITLSAEGKTPDYIVKSDNRGFTLSLTKDGLDKVNAKTHPETGEGVAVEFTLTYSATVNKNAVVDKPEKNDIKLEYSNNPKKEKEPTPVTPQNGELKVTKTWENKGENEDAEVVYTLSNGTISAAVMLNGKEDNGTKYDLGNGITFEVTGAYAGAFKGEALKTGDWTISERVAGYDETIDATTTAGTAAITNKKDTENPTPLNPTEPKVVYYGKRFVKADKNTGERLQGAEFVVKNSAGKFLALKDLDTTQGEGQALEIAKENYTKAIETWNKAVAENNKLDADKKVDDSKLSATITVKSIGTDGVESKQETLTGKTAVENRIAELKDAYFKAFAKVANKYEWVDSKDAANVVKLISDKQGKFEITGLEKGTYNLVETKAPQDYAKKTEEEEFTVEAGTYAAHANGVTYESDNSVDGDTGAEAQRIDNKKVSIPQTGGIGSLIFVIAGLAIMAGAYVAYRKNQARA